MKKPKKKKIDMKIVFSTRLFQNYSALCFVLRKMIFKIEFVPCSLSNINTQRYEQVSFPFEIKWRESIS